MRTWLAHDSVHALYAMYTTTAHVWALAYVQAAKLAVGAEYYPYGEEKHADKTNSTDN